LPAGFVDRDHGRLRVIAARLAFDEMARLLADPARHGMEVSGGRGGSRRVVLPGGQTVYCRRYLRGGLVRHVVRDLYLLRPERPIAELIVTETARAAGCSVAPVLACAVEDVGPFYRGWIVTEEVGGARSLVDVLAESAATKRDAILVRVGDAIADLYRIGVYHVDLTGHNVLIRPDGQPVVIDFDRARTAAPYSAVRSRASLRRFRRSLDKLLRGDGEPLAPDEWARVESRAIKSAGIGTLRG
jgi:tRNA A-37 threonylcarbamoyl transferase component Bud32